MIKGISKIGEYSNKNHMPYTIIYNRGHTSDLQSKLMYMPVYIKQIIVTPTLTSN